MLDNRCESAQDEIGYEVIMQESTGSTWYSTFAGSNKCKDGNCSAEIRPATSDHSYIMSLHAVSTFGMLELFASNMEISMYVCSM